MKTDWKTSLVRYQRIASRIERWTRAARTRRMNLARQLLCKAGLGPNGFLEAHNWGTALAGDQGMLCQRALRLANDWRPLERGNRLTAMAWNRYMVPAGAPRSVIPNYSR